MGRWDDGIYDSDASLDFFDRITNRIIREISFWTSPEQINKNSHWLTQLITLVELMLLIDKREIGSTVFLSDMKDAVVRWRKIFFEVWDAEWTEESGEYWTIEQFSSYENRSKHRKTLEVYFDRLEEITNFWELVTKSLNTDFKASQIDKLPYFFEIGKDDKEHPISSWFVGNLVEELKHQIVFCLSDENRDRAVGFFELEYVWVSIDIICHFCEAYRMSPSIKEETISSWLEKTVSIWKERLHKESQELLEEDELYKNALALFERLRTLAQTYPSIFPI